MAGSSPDKKPLSSLDEDDDSDEEEEPPELKYITDSGQICYDKILPKDLNTARKQSRQSGPAGAPAGILRAAAEVKKLWHKKTLNVHFMEKSDREDEIFRWANRWCKYCGIQFKKIDTPFESDIRITYSDAGAWSFVGTDAISIPTSSATMNLGFVDRCTVLHEFGHALGMIHEHQNPEDGGFEWNRQRVVRDLTGAPNYWDKAAIRSNMFQRYNRSLISGTAYDNKSIMHYSFPGSWIKSKKFPNGIPQNWSLSKSDKKLVRKLYGPSQSKMSGGPPPSKKQKATKDDTQLSSSTIVPYVATIPESNGQLPPAFNSKAFSVPVYEPHKGVLASSDDELIVRFHTSADEDPKLHTLVTTGTLDTVVTLMGPDNPEKFIASNDNDGDGLNAKLEETLIPDSDYFLLIRTLDADGGEFKLSITAN